MKKSTLFAALMLFVGVSASAQTGYCTKACDANAESTFNWDDATNFCPIITSDAVQETIAPQMKLDLRVDDTVSHLWVWSDTYVGNDADGANSFGDFGGYIDFSVTSVGWSGLGIINENPINFSFLDEGGYYLHFGTKGSTDPQCIGFCDGKFSIGDGAFVDNGNSLKNVGNWVADGEWYYFDIPVDAIYQVMNGKGNVFTDANGGQTAYKSNYFWALSGATTGKHLIIENCFLYQKKSEANGIKDINVASTREGKFMENGRVVIVKNGKKFNTVGQIVK